MARRNKPQMELTSPSFQANELLPREFAFIVADGTHRMREGDNRNPPLTWKNLPDRTRSLVLVCHDGDAVADESLADRLDVTIPRNAPRVDFYHWVLVDIDPQMESIAAGAFSDGFVVGGKGGPEGPYGTRQGLNDFTYRYRQDEEMRGRYFGYDGPAPPFNDVRMHRIHFTLYALRTNRCPVDGIFDASTVLEAIEGSVLGRASLTAVYTINPSVNATILREHAVVKGGQHPGRPT